MSLQQGPLDLFLLRGSIAVVTGAGNGGIGYGICARACEMGLDVAMLDLHAGVVTAAVASLQAAYPSSCVRGFRCDVTKPEELDSVAKMIEASFGGHRIGALFANAGVFFNTGDKGVLTGSIDAWRTTLDVNILGIVHTLRTFVPLMQCSVEPSVVCTTASIAGILRGVPSMAAYFSSKHAVVVLTEALSLELAKDHSQIRVHVLCPCIVKTSLEETTKTNMSAQQGDSVAPIDIDDVRLDSSSLLLQRSSLAQMPMSHAVQTWDRIAAGEFYMITDGVRPYVDHDFPFLGSDMVYRRFDAMLQPDFHRRIDNAGAFSNTSRSPMAIELVRRASQQQSKL